MGLVGEASINDDPDGRGRYRTRSHGACRHNLNDARTDARTQRHNRLPDRICRNNGRGNELSATRAVRDRERELDRVRHVHGETERVPYLPGQRRRFQTADTMHGNLGRIRLQECDRLRNATSAPAADLRAANHRDVRRGRCAVGFDRRDNRRIPPSRDVERQDDGRGAVDRKRKTVGAVCPRRHRHGRRTERLGRYRHARQRRLRRLIGDNSCHAPFPARGPFVLLLLLHDTASNPIAATSRNPPTFLRIGWHPLRLWIRRYLHSVFRLAVIWCSYFS